MEVRIESGFAAVSGLRSPLAEDRRAGPPLHRGLAGVLGRLRRGLREGVRRFPVRARPRAHRGRVLRPAPGRAVAAGGQIRGRASGRFVPADGARPPAPRNSTRPTGGPRPWRRKGRRTSSGWNLQHRSARRRSCTSSTRTGRTTTPNACASGRGRCGKHGPHATRSCAVGRNCDRANVLAEWLRLAPAQELRVPCRVLRTCRVGWLRLFAWRREQRCALPCPGIVLR